MWKRLIRYTRSFFNFSHAEAKGFLAMAGFLLILSLIFIVYDHLPSKGYTTYVEDQKILDSLVVVLESGSSANSAHDRELPAREKTGSSEIRLFAFNPNTLSADSLKLLGIPAWLAQRMVNYRQKGGVFRREEDLLKIYGFPDSLFRSLEPYLEIPAAKDMEAGKKPFSTDFKDEAKKKEKRKEKSGQNFNLNQVDSLELQQIKGIGPVLSSRIIRFRDKLGGFVRMEQLYEVYGLDSMVVESLAAQAFIEQGFVAKQLPVNSASQEELATHPYINPAQARLLVAFRNEHGPFEMVDELVKIHTFDRILVNKIAPYIRLD